MLSGSPLFAAEVPQEDRIPETVVTASRVEEEPFLAGQSVDVLSKRELQQRQPRTAPEALRESPGVFVQETNFGGGSPIVRGMVGPQVLLLIDGIRLNNAVFRTGPLQYFNLLDQYEIDRFEVVRGPGSILYGSDALGATINALTLVPKDRRGADAAGTDLRLAGRFGSAALDKTGHGFLDAGLSWFRANASATVKDFDNLEGGRGVGTQPHTSYRQVNTSGKVTARAPDGALKDWSATLGYHLSRMMDVGRAEQLASKQRYNIYQNDHDLVYARGAGGIGSIDSDLVLTVHYQRFLEDRATHQLDAARSHIQGSAYETITVNTAGVDAQSTSHLLERRMRLVYGVEYHKDFVDSSGEKLDREANVRAEARPPYPEGSRFELGGMYLSAQGEILPPDRDFGLRLTAGYRFQHMGGAADAREGFSAVDYANRAHVFMAGVQGSYKRHWMSAITWSQGFRAPNLDETVAIGDLGDWYQVPNEGLGPERSDTFELVNRFGFWRLSGSLAGYVTLLSDFIRREPATLDGRDTYNGLPVIQNANGGEARVYGVEGQLKVRLWHGLSVAGSITSTQGVEILDREAREKDPAYRDARPLSKIPPLFGDARLRWDTRFNADVRFFAETYFLFAAMQDRLSDTDMQDVRIPKGGTPGWVTWNVRSGLDLHDIAGIVLVVENLTNTKYKYHASGVYGAGTNAILGAEIRY
jgi:outer membrane receptor protein involved in Fe transport